MNPAPGPAALRRPLRTGLRTARFGLLLARTAAEIAFGSGDPRAAVRRACGRLLRIMNVRVGVQGPLPSRGLVVCNHLGYLDVPVLLAAVPAVFVAKSEVKAWPLLGWFVRKAGTLFVDRNSRSASGRASSEIGAALAGTSPVVLFPEGTSSGGAGVLPFKSSLLESARGGTIWAAALAYDLDADDGDSSEVVCYWKDMAFLPHLARLFGTREIRATLVFAPVDAADEDRKVLALRLHRIVSDLKNGKAQAAVGAGIPFDWAVVGYFGFRSRIR
jgi:1-acyl-sn-glycerol-3-phosphate acyltransferase